MKYKILRILLKCKLKYIRSVNNESSLENKADIHIKVRPTNIF